MNDSEVTWPRMAGAGNCFAMVLLDPPEASGSTAPSELGGDPSAALLARGLELCARESLDGLLFVGHSARADARMVVVNADGSRPEACGNGLRCAAVFAVRSGLARGPQLSIETDSGVRHAELLAGGTVRASLGRADVTEFEIEFGAARRRAFEVHVGNPHAVLFAEPTEPVSLADLAAPDGPLRGLPRFASGVNIELARPVGPAHYRAQVDERGVGPTAACGTGACAVAAAAWETGAVAEGEEVRVSFPGGELAVSRRHGVRGELWLRGEVEDLAV